MACGRRGYLGLVRLEDGRLNLAAALDPCWMRVCGGPGPAAARLLAEVGWPPVPNLAEQNWRGTPALTRQARRRAAERLFLIGDAAGYIEPFTGEGMAWALAAGTGRRSSGRAGRAVLASATGARVGHEVSPADRHAATHLPRRRCRAAFAAADADDGSSARMRRQSSRHP